MAPGELHREHGMLVPIAGRQRASPPFVFVYKSVMVRAIPVNPSEGGFGANKYMEDF